MEPLHALSCTEPFELPLLYKFIVRLTRGKHSLQHLPNRVLAALCATQGSRYALWVGKVEISNGFARRAPRKTRYDEHAGIPSPMIFVVEDDHDISRLITHNLQGGRICRAEFF
jgi:hypothetical protein